MGAAGEDSEKKKSEPKSEQQEASYAESRGPVAGDTEFNTLDLHFGSILPTSQCFPGLSG